jgi:hypothetical protein
MVDEKLLHGELLKSTISFRNRGSSVSIVSDYGLDDRGSIPDRVTEFFF